MTIGSSSQNGVMGYATRSPGSARVMRAVDFLHPWKKHGSLEWGKTNSIASLAGLGDLIVQLPLIDALVRLGGEKGTDTRVLLRPAHVEIGKRCGWNVVPVENPLQFAFNRKLNWQVLQQFATESLFTVRRFRFDLCIDLTGSAFNALFLKSCGVRKLASRQTRGGASLIDVVLPHIPFENEYAYQEQLAEFFTCKPDPAVYSRLISGTKAKNPPLLLSVSTGCSWRNWPLRNFMELAKGFASLPIQITGHRAELSAEDQVSLSELEGLPHVTSLVDRLTPLELIETVSQARAVVTNDTATAHIANAFNVRGAVLFGPESSTTWGKATGLRLFHDQTCRFYPCNQWSCQNPREWCMEKITVSDVATYLRQELGPPAP